jgi:CreA protein
VQSIRSDTDQDDIMAKRAPWGPNDSFMSREWRASDGEREPFRTMRAVVFVVALCVALCAAPVRADSIGEVDTVFKWIGPDHKIVVDAYDDPKVAGVTCYLSRAKTGGVKGAVGVAEDLAEASIACRQVGPIKFAQSLPVQEEMFSERISLVFKKLRVVRMVDAKRNTLVYLTYSDRVVDGYPQNAVTAVAVDHAMPIPLK